MIPVSAEFHSAVRNGEKQRVFVHFTERDIYFTIADIVLKSWKYENGFNPQNDLTIGATPSASLDYQLVNDQGMLNSFDFGEFDAYRGVRLAHFPYPVGGPTVDFGGQRIVGHDTVPYLTVGGQAWAYQPSFPAKALVVLEDTLYVIGANREVFIVSIEDATTWADQAPYTWLSQANVEWDDYDGTVTTGTTTVTDNLMWHMLQRYVTNGTGLSYVGAMVTIFEGGIAEQYEYCKIGHFYAERPSRVKTNIVQVNAYDAMSAILDRYPDSVSITYPTTMEDLFEALCTSAGITHKVDVLMNGSIVVPGDITQQFTYRELIGKIAEASCTYARFDYDGVLDLCWFTETTLSIDEHDYVKFVPYEYQVHPINKLQVRSSTSDIGIIIGSGTNGYVIQSNPFLTFSSDSEGQVYCRPIYTRLSSFPAYTPGTLDWFADWSYQPGDVIEVEYQTETFRFPIFMQNISGNLAKGDAECTGEEYREVMDAVSREEYRMGFRFTEINRTIEGVALKCGLENVPEGESLYTEIQVVAGGLNSKVSKGSVISEINQSPEEVKINANRITLNGTASFNNNVVIGTDGKITANQGTFTNAVINTANIDNCIMTNAQVSGVLYATPWTFNTEGAFYSNGGVTIRMRYYGNYVMFRGTGASTIYGADADHDVFLTGKNAYIAGTDNSQAVRVGSFISPATGEYYADACLVNTGASAGDEKGNVGTADRRWDMVYCRSVSQSSSRTIKENIQAMPDVGDVIDRLAPVSFDYKKNGKHSYGFILEDTIGLVPEACDDGKGNLSIGGIDYTKFVPIIVRELQSLRQRVRALE